MVDILFVHFVVQRSMLLATFKIDPYLGGVATCDTIIPQVQDLPYDKIVITIVERDT